MNRMEWNREGIRGEIRGGFLPIHGIGGGFQWNHPLIPWNLPPIPPPIPLYMMVTRFQELTPDPVSPKSIFQGLGVDTVESLIPIAKNYI